MTPIKTSMTISMRVGVQHKPLIEEARKLAKWEDILVAGALAIVDEAKVTLTAKGKAAAEAFQQTTVGCRCRLPKGSPGDVCERCGGIIN